MNSRPQKLIDVQKLLPVGYDSIALDIVGFCNANCKYCPATKVRNGGYEDELFITIELYEKIIQKLIDYKFYAKETKFHVYCLGEPFLHPQLNELLKITDKYGVRTALSTNASKIPNLDRDGLQCVDRVLISMPGFSQESYDKIHGFNFEKIKKNIIKIKKIFDELRQGDDLIPFDMSYHIYQFNQNEISLAKKFCEENGIRFALNYAVLMDKKQSYAYATNSMSYEELKDISKDLFLGVLDYQISVSPKNYCDFQERFLSINEKGDVKNCSGFTSEYDGETLCGNLITDNIDEIIHEKYSNAWCNKCIKAGLSMEKGYTCKVFPDYYYSILKENEYLKMHNSESKKKQLEEELEFMHMLRLWEEECYSENTMNNLQIIINTKQYSKDFIKNMILQYGRFPEQTYKKLSEIVYQRGMEN